MDIQFNTKVIDECIEKLEIEIEKGNNKPDTICPPPYTTYYSLEEYLNFYNK